MATPLRFTSRPKDKKTNHHFLYLLVACLISTHLASQTSGPAAQAVAPGEEVKAGTKTVTKPFEAPGVLVQLNDALRTLAAEYLQQ